MNKLLQKLGVSGAVLGLAVTPVGLVSANADIGTTGPDSTNKIELRSEARHRVTNNNNLSAENNNPQSANSGDSKVYDNTEGGDAESGSAMNDSFLSVSADVDNSSASEGAFCGCEGGGLGDVDASIERTGPDSYNKIEVKQKSDVRVTNNNNISVTNNNSQSATSGDASVKHNTEAGDATSGDAENVSTTTIDLMVTN